MAWSAQRGLMKFNKIDMKRSYLSYGGAGFRNIKVHSDTSVKVIYVVPSLASTKRTTIDNNSNVELLVFLSRQLNFIRMDHRTLANPRLCISSFSPWPSRLKWMFLILKLNCLKAPMMNRSWTVWKRWIIRSEILIDARVITTRSGRDYFWYLEETEAELETADPPPLLIFLPC